jgi:hypothetical protein
MKSDLLNLTVALLSALVVLTSSGRAQDKAGCEVTVAALTLPGDSGGLLHVRTSEAATTPLQLSTRYFSARVKLPGKVIQFFKDPVAAKPAGQAPAPLLTLQIPAETRLAYAVLWTETNETQTPVWKGRVLDAKDWDRSCLIVFNATTEAIGIRAGAKQILLEPGKSVDFPSRLWSEPFPAKIYQLQPEQKAIFSSTWQVSAGSRELCFIYRANDAFSLRSVLDIAPSPDQATP